MKIIDLLFLANKYPLMLVTTCFSLSFKIE